MKNRKLSKKSFKNNKIENSNFKKIDISTATKQSLVVVFLFVLAVIFILAYFNLAGPVGEWIFLIFEKILGWGYFILPSILILIAFNFTRILEEKRFSYLSTFFGALLILLSSLAILEAFFPKQGGLLGRIGTHLIVPFGFWVSLIILFAFLIAGILITFNSSLSVFFNIFKRQEKEQLDNEVILQNEKLNNNTEQVTSTSEEIKTNQINKEKEPILAIPQKILSAKENIKDKKTEPIFNSVIYKNPPLSILENDTTKPTVGDIKANANIIKRTLESFGIEVEMSEVNVGPSVTQYTLKPAQGIKLSAITALHNDLSLALAAHPLRIEAPIPGKALVGIEVPNKAISLVRLGNLLSEEQFKNSASPLIFALGRDVSGKSLFADLKKMPHLLIAGATGSGKSICIHSILSSFLFKNSPEILRFILIDPKRVELSRYNGIPHLLTPIINENKKALPAMKWLIKEMERRYGLFLEVNVRDINGFNNRALQKKETILPYIVVIVDELADLMIYYGKEIEGYILKLAQMARATGIHLILSTQRPSVEVITGLIKANITARVAFQVVSQVDSRTILDMSGAEKLLGHGDMLYLAPDSSKPRRVQGVYVSEKEVENLSDFLVKESWSKSQDSNIEGDLQLEESLQKSILPEIDLDISVASQEDELYETAYEIIVQAGKASASFLQRRLKIGYARAARLLDLLENQGVIGPADGAKPREVFIKKDEFSNTNINDV